MNKPIILFAIKSFSGLGNDGISNSNTAVFGRLDPQEIKYVAEVPDGFVPRGAITPMELRAKNSYVRLWEKLRLLRRMKPDILVGISTPVDILFLIMKPRKTKYVIFCHTMLLRSTKGEWRVRTPWWIRKIFFNSADCVIAVSEFSTESVRKLFPARYVVSALVGVNLDVFHPSKKNEQHLATTLDVNFSRPMVLFVGLLQPRKRPDVFIELARRMPEASFVMIGRSSPAFDYFKDTADIKNLKWIERVTLDDLTALFASARVFIFPSLQEPGAAVILEAMASGAIPIVSASGGNGEFFVDGKSGFLVPVDNKEIDAFIEKIKQVVSVRGVYEKMSPAAREEAERHSYGVTAEKYRSIILSLCRDREKAE